MAYNFYDLKSTSKGLCQKIQNDILSPLTSKLDKISYV